MNLYLSGSVITPSVYTAKEDFAPLDPAECAAAVLETDWVSFAYKPPVYVEPDPAPEEKVRRLRQQRGQGREEVGADAKLEESKHHYAEMLAMGEPARHQKGDVLQSLEHTTHALFGLSDRENASHGSDLAVVACALQSALQRIAALEANGATAP